MEHQRPDRLQHQRAEVVRDQRLAVLVHLRDGVRGAEAGPPRDVHREHEDLYRAAIGRQEARAALALEAHVRNTCEVLKKAGLGVG